MLFQTSTVISLGCFVTISCTNSMRGLYIGDYTTQLYRDYNGANIRIPMECHKGTLDQCCPGQHDKVGQFPRCEFDPRISSQFT